MAANFETELVCPALRRAAAAFLCQQRSCDEVFRARCKTVFIAHDGEMLEPLSFFPNITSIELTNTAL